MEYDHGSKWIKWSFYVFILIITEGILILLTLLKVNAQKAVTLHSVTFSAVSSSNIFQIVKIYYRIIFFFNYNNTKYIVIDKFS